MASTFPPLKSLPLFLLLLMAAAVLHAQDAEIARLPPGEPAIAAVERPGTDDPGIVVTTRDEGRLYFREGDWSLTWEGIRGRATVQTPDGLSATRDTTLSYADAVSASSSGRGTSASQFALTLLGIILVIGLAALILYAAFLATDR